MPRKTTDFVQTSTPWRQSNEGEERLNTNHHEKIKFDIIRFVLSPSLFLLLINDLSTTECPNHSYADDSTLHYSTTFKSRSSQTEPHNARLDARERLASDLYLFWLGQKDPSVLQCLKTQFLHLSTRHHLPDTYPLFFDNTRLSPSSTVNSLGLSLSNKLNRKFHTSSFAKSASAFCPVSGNTCLPPRCLQGPCPSLYGVCV